MDAHSSGWFAAANVISQSRELAALRGALDAAPRPAVNYQLTAREGRIAGFTLLHHAVSCSYWAGWRGDLSLIHI